MMVGGGGDSRENGRGTAVRVLVVEDDPKLAGFIVRGLEEERYAVDRVGSGDDALAYACSIEYDLILLDLMIPGRDGTEVCRELRRRRRRAPILMLTALDRVQDRVEGLDAGADDYLTKPFAFEELLARMRALLRRRNMIGQGLVKVADLELDQVSHRVTRAGGEIELTGREYALLEYLMVNAGRTVTRTMIAEHVWNESFDTYTNVIDVYVAYLRNKIDRGRGKRLIRTVRGVGYRLEG
jgi:DNA-binding response OmpR family regulator